MNSNYSDSGDYSFRDLYADGTSGSVDPTKEELSAIQVHNLMVERQKAIKRARKRTQRRKRRR